MSSSAGRGPAVALVLGSCVSLQVGAAFAARLLPVAGSTGTTLLRLGLAALALLVAVRPRAHRWDARQWLPVLAFGLTLAAMNGSFYAAIERIPLGTAVTIEFLGPLTLAAVLSRRLRELTWVLLAAAGVALLGLGDGAGPGSTGRRRAGAGGRPLLGVLHPGQPAGRRPRPGARRAGARDRGRGAGAAAVRGGRRRACARAAAPAAAGRRHRPARVRRAVLAGAGGAAPAARARVRVLLSLEPASRRRPAGCC